MLPDSVGRLTGPQSLDLGWCSTLHTLPDSIGNLTGLQCAGARLCRGFQARWEPDGPPMSYVVRVLHSADAPRFGREADVPQSLHLGGCSTPRTLPNSLGNLTGLQTLLLDGCSTLQTLPNSVGNLTGLESLNLGWCSAMQTLPDSVGKSEFGRVLRSAGATRFGG